METYTVIAPPFPREDFDDLDKAISHAVAVSRRSHHQYGVTVYRDDAFIAQLGPAGIEILPTVISRLNGDTRAIVDDL